MRYRPASYLLWIAVSSTLVIAACGDPELAANGPVEVTSSGLVTADQFFTDASGDVTIMIRTCDWPASFTTGPRCAYCATDAGWQMIGGGADIQLQSTTAADARLRGSFPYPHTLSANGDGVVAVHSPDQTDRNCTGNANAAQDRSATFVAWMARSGGTSAHKLRAYVIGLRIGDLATTELDVNFHDKVTDAPARTQVVETVPDRGFFIGGGVDLVGTNASGYLTESYLNTSTQAWRGVSFDPTATTDLKVYAIGIRPTRLPPTWEMDLQIPLRAATTGPVSTGTGTASAATSYPMVLAGLGATGVTNDPRSRYVTGMVPFAGSSQGFTVKTRDGLLTAGGSTTGSSLNMIGGRWGTWLHNAIRFTGAGTTLWRPTGTAPVRLQQANVAPQRWHLEDIGGGRFRIRNANPSRPEQGECAFFQSSTGNPVVGPCGTGTQYSWTILDDVRSGRFKLRNVASGSCLDNANVNGTTNLTLKPCASGFSSAQALFLDVNNWP